MGRELSLSQAQAKAKRGDPPHIGDHVLMTLSWEDTAILIDISLPIARVHCVAVHLRGLHKPSLGLGYLLHPSRGDENYHHDTPLIKRTHYLPIISYWPSSPSAPISQVSQSWHISSFWIFSTFFNYWKG